MNKLIKILLISFSSIIFSFSAFAGGHKYSGPDLKWSKSCNVWSMVITRTRNNERSWCYI